MTTAVYRKARGKWARSEKGRAYRKRWRLAHPDKERAQKKRSYVNNRTARLRYAFEHAYGITVEQRDELLAAQGGRCKICRTSEHGAKSRGWHTDHNPRKSKGSIGFVRGILCLNCNTGLGRFLDNPDLLHAAANYIEEN